MTPIDYIIIFLYLTTFLAIGFFFKENKSSKDYFLGGRSVSWGPLTLSTMATQLSAISFISAPAFVGLKNGGGKIHIATPLSSVSRPKPHDWSTCTLMSLLDWPSTS